MKLLLADDERGMLRMIGLFLESQGYQVDLTFDGTEALTRFEQNPDSYDVLLLDLRMPGLSGMEVLQNIRQKGYLNKVIIMSGHSPLIDEARNMAIKPDAILSKPFQPEELTDILKSFECDE